MIGVIANPLQESTVEEFFQLFKVPWEFLDKEKRYDVIISTDGSKVLPTARLIIIFNSKKTLFDSENDLQSFQHKGNALLDNEYYQFPVYKNLLKFQSAGKPVIKVKNEDEVAGLEFVYADRKILRIGYDLFDEIEFILATGQEIEYAHIPTVDVHIALLRSWILQSGLSLIEIPPVPYGYNFITCLTHDVDFISIRSHKLDHSVLGFIFRIFHPYSLRDFRSNISWNKLFKNLKALIFLPGVYMGIVRDFWFQLDRYMEIEDGLSSTYYFIPFRDFPGEKDMKSNKPSKYRSARYDINDYKIHLLKLIRKGHEVGLHGIDAWNKSDKGKKEHDVIHDITGEDMGVRMHWLYFSGHSAKVLEDTGFIYDSTIGYNEIPGYKAGTSQVYRLPATRNFLELPLIAMDTSLFYPDRMGLSETGALQLCKKIISEIKTFGGVFTINWHQRSLAPERNWDDFYIELLRILKRENAWFATAMQAVKWFNKRRSIKFKNIKYSKEKIEVKLDANNDTSPVMFSLRLHYPEDGQSDTAYTSNYQRSFVDVPWSGEPAVEFIV